MERLVDPRASLEQEPGTEAQRRDSRTSDGGDGGDAMARLRQWKIQRRADERSALRVQRKVGWSDPGAGANAGETSVASAMRRVPLEGLTSLGGKGQAIVALAAGIDAKKSVEVLLHLHGHNPGYKAAGKSTRDESIDRIEQQIEASGRGQMIGILPQGTGDSSFAPSGSQKGDKGFDAQALIDEVLGRLASENVLSPKPAVQNVVLSAHSGGGEPLGQILENGKGPQHLGEVALFDAVNYTTPGGKVSVGDELPRIERWLTKQLDGDLAALKGKPSSQARKDYLAQSLRFHAYHSSGGGYAEVHDSKDPKGKHSNDALPATPPNGTSFIPLADWLTRWFNTHAAELNDPDAWALFRANYQVVDIGLNQGNHDQVVGHGELQSDLKGLPPLQPKRGPNSGDADATDDAAAHVERAAGEGGEAVPAGVRSRVEHATGADLSGVRVHHGAASDRAASSVQALAYTRDQDIHFAAGQYQPGTAHGDRLLAHELVHTVQQRGAAPMAGAAKLAVSPVDDPAEAEADAVADAALSGGQRAVREAPGLGVSRPPAGTPPTSTPKSPKHPEDFPTYEEWLQAFMTIDQDQFTADDAPAGGLTTGHQVLGEKADDTNPAAPARKAGPARGGEAYIDHVSDTWIKAHLPDELRLAVYQLPSDCADVAVMLRHVYVFAHGRTEVFGGWTIGVGAGKTEDARAASLRKIQNEVYSGNVASMVAPYTDDAGKPAKAFGVLKHLLHPGDVLVWEHHRDGKHRSGGHTQTIERVSRDDDGAVTSIQALQGNEPLGPDQVPSIQADEKKNKRPIDSEDTLRHLPGRRIELGTLTGTDLQDQGPQGQWSWGRDDNHTWLIAAGPPAGVKRPPHVKKKGDKTARGIADWFPTLIGAGPGKLPGAFEAALLEARAAVEGGLEGFSDAQATELGQSAGKAVAKVRKKDASGADALRAELLAQVNSIGSHAAEAAQAPGLATLFARVAAGVAEADPIAPAAPEKAPEAAPDKAVGAGATQ